MIGWLGRESRPGSSSDSPEDQAPGITMGDGRLVLIPEQQCERVCAGHRADRRHQRGIRVLRLTCLAALQPTQLRLASIGVHRVQSVAVERLVQNELALPPRFRRPLFSPVVGERGGS
jgi:hypothetical protein